MGLDMYLYKIKKHNKFRKETIIKMANDLYGNKELQDKTSNLYQALKDLTYEETRYDFKGQEVYLDSEVAYWRKANAIHNYIYTNFAEEYQHDYDTIFLTKENLTDLLIDCKKVLNDLTEDKIIEKIEKQDFFTKETYYNYIYDSKLAREILPTTDGFFFGSTDYDNYYKEDIENTIEQLEKVLTETDFENEEIYYVASY